MILSTTPRIDLHGMDKTTARLAVEDFLFDMCKLKEKECIIIHGIGEGILKKEVHETLKRDKRVASFTLSFTNPGCTIVKLQETVDK